MKLDKVDNKSRRLRKKLYLGEFAVYGFQLQSQLTCDAEQEYDEFTDELMALLESRELCCVCGASNGVCDAIIMPETRYGSPSEEDRQVLNDWLKGHAKVTEFQLGELLDLTYGEFADFS
ncbi:YggL family protein [Shewanella corallii]|uniref:YggL family protein n=1 Tax=Shewanella corallii TaxID=560080 RepID=A0ABT0N7U5_9GAMM|nr:50S ribosome-binding protein YggL [Shewanella corallii]MCL2913897.1 YggL family protein [Shewanella corallii]